jgi:hypothetical protein
MRSCERVVCTSSDQTERGSNGWPMPKRERGRRVQVNPDSNFLVIPATAGVPFPLSPRLHHARGFVYTSSPLFVALNLFIVPLLYSQLPTSRHRPFTRNYAITSTATQCIVTTRSLLLHLRAPDLPVKTICLAHTSRSPHNRSRRARHSLQSPPRHNLHSRSHRAQIASINRPRRNYKSRGVHQELSAFRRPSCRNRTRKHSVHSAQIPWRRQAPISFHRKQCANRLSTLLRMTPLSSAIRSRSRTGIGRIYH